MGTVIQGARVTAGSLISNILGSLPLDAEAAWRAAELAQIAADIRAMPMGMSTVVPEGGTGFSGVTRVVAAHRLSTVRHADRIVVLDQGRLVEEGTFEELRAAGGLFAQLAQRQTL